MSRISEAHFWFLLLLGVVAVTAAVYIARHFRYASENRDITAEQPDLSWRSNANLLKMSLLLGGTLVLAAFSFTPQAAYIVSSPNFMSLIFGLLAAGAAWNAVRGAWTGENTLYLKWHFGPYRHDAQPVRYWLAMAQDILLIFLMLMFATGALQ